MPNASPADSAPRVQRAGSAGSGFIHPHAGCTFGSPSLSDPFRIPQIHPPASGTPVAASVALGVRLTKGGGGPSEGSCQLWRSFDASVFPTGWAPRKGAPVHFVPRGRRRVSCGKFSGSRPGRSASGPGHRQAALEAPGARPLGRAPTRGPGGLDARARTRGSTPMETPRRGTERSDRWSAGSDSDDAQGVRPPLHGDRTRAGSAEGIQGDGRSVCGGFRRRLQGMVAHLVALPSVLRACKVRGARILRTSACRWGSSARRRGGGIGANQGRAESACPNVSAGECRLPLVTVQRLQ